MNQCGKSSRAAKVHRLLGRPPWGLRSGAVQWDAVRRACVEYFCSFSPYMFVDRGVLLISTWTLIMSARAIGGRRAAPFNGFFAPGATVRVTKATGVRISSVLPVFMLT